MALGHAGTTWRKPSPALEKMALLLCMGRRHGENFGKLVCWSVTNCPPAGRERCVAYQTRQGHLCWFLTGNLNCAQKPLGSWAEKKQVCSRCLFFRKLLGSGSPTSERTREPREAALVATEP